MYSLYWESLGTSLVTWKEDWVVIGGMLTMAVGVTLSLMPLAEVVIGSLVEMEDGVPLTLVAVTLELKVTLDIVAEASVEVAGWYSTR